MAYLKNWTSREMTSILIVWTLPSTGMGRGEVFAISDCLVIICSHWAKSRYLTCQYHQREPHFIGTNLFRYIYSKYFFLLDIPNSQLKPANSHKQNGRRPKQVLPCIDHSPYPSCIPSPQECIRPILFCSWNLYEHEKWISPSPNWDGQPVGRHFQNGRHQN